MWQLKDELSSINIELKFLNFFIIIYYYVPYTATMASGKEKEVHQD